MDLGLAGRVVYVTGGSRGVGRAVVERMLVEGASVATCARNGDALADAFMSTAPDRLLLSSCDVCDRDAVHADVNRVIRHFGRLDAVVANAGEGTVGGVLETTSDEFDAQFSVKVHSVLHVVQAAHPHLVQCDAPAVVVITGITAHAPDSDMAAVSTARAAVGNLIHLLARQLVVDGIRVNAVNLGAIATDPQRRRHEASGSEQDFEQWCAQEAVRRKIPLGRMGRADEVAPTVALLVSPLSSYITGASVDVSGGGGSVPGCEAQLIVLHHGAMTWQGRSQVKGRVSRRR